MSTGESPSTAIGSPSRTSSGPLHAVVTGASSGIGAATVRALRAAGWEVTAAARRADRLKQLAAETGARAAVVDVTDEESVERLVREVTGSGEVNAVINNAGGAFGMETVAEARTADWEHMYNVNVSARCVSPAVSCPPCAPADTAASCS
jgi:NADP-dependent 3-hydroxy acid dehydrogenase YdfG